MGPARKPKTRESHTTTCPSSFPKANKPYIAARVMRQAAASAYIWWSLWASGVGRVPAGNLVPVRIGAGAGSGCEFLVRLPVFLCARHAGGPRGLPSGSPQSAQRSASGKRPAYTRLPQGTAPAASDALGEPPGDSSGTEKALRPAPSPLPPAPHHPLPHSYRHAPRQKGKLRFDVCREPPHF